jgi:phosphoribosylamine--glycine ligase
MRILIIGSGGREHALARSLSQSSRTEKLFVAPGNAGTASLADNVDLEASEAEALRDFALSEDLDLTVVGPEKPLVAGLVDQFEEAGLAVVGPSREAARLEGSKAFAKSFMQEHGIPTARHRTFDSSETDEARSYLEEHDAPVVVKASGLAGGKGAFVCETLDDAFDALRRIAEERDFGAAGDRIVIEELMRGEEASVFALTDGENYVLLPPAQDHKRIGEGDTGPNTGGMGAYAPAPVVTPKILQQTCRRIIEPTLAGMQAAGAPYRGVLYCGLMITDEGPKVVEFNCRLGDPEAQVVLPLLETDLTDVFERLAARNLGGVQLRSRPGAAACVVLASDGYPTSYETGFPINGLEASPDDALVFQAGTAREGSEQIVTDGGRVLDVTGLGAGLPEALDAAYDAVEHIHFDGMQYRRDIGEKGLKRL